MLNQFSRTELQLGAENMDKLRRAKVAVFGIGGVGGHCAEALCRTGVGAIDLYDNDKICLTNLNRQLVAVHSTVGQYKADAMRDRLLDINPDAKIGAIRLFYGTDNADSVDLEAYDYIVDAVDTMTAKLELACRAYALGVPIISAMGAANKLDPTAFRVSDLFQTEMCPLARIMRHELRRRGVKNLKVVWSPEQPIAPLDDDACRDECAAAGTERSGTARRQIPASNAFVPPVAGLIMAGTVVRDLIGM